MSLLKIILIASLTLSFISCESSNGPEVIVAAQESNSDNAREIFVIADIHGDLDRVQNLLRGLHLINGQNKWPGEDSIVVQLGDQIDRWIQDRQTIEFFDELKEQARKVGGDVHSLIGNHEIMNSKISSTLFRLSPSSMLPFKEFNSLYSSMSDECKRTYQKKKKRYIETSAPQYKETVRDYIKRVEKMGLLGRIAAFCPGGPFALKMAKRPFSLILNDTLFIHGSMRRKYSRKGREGLQKLNEELSKWFLGEEFTPTYHHDFYRGFIRDRDAPFLSRFFGEDETPEKCAELDEILKDLNVKRIVVGHTIQIGGISSICGNRAYRADVGFSRGFLKKNVWNLPRKLGAIKIQGDKVEVVTVDDNFNGREMIEKSEAAIAGSTFNCLDYEPPEENLAYFRCPDY